MSLNQFDWCHNKGSIVPENTWHTGLDEFTAKLNSASGQSWWICDPYLKYLNIRIDTRDNAFILTIDGKNGSGKAERIDPQRVVNAIDDFKAKYGKSR